MAAQRRQYDREFKVSAVRLLEQSDQPLVEVARSLGIHETMLRKWQRQVHQGGAESFSQAGRQPMDELLRLQRENRQLKRDLDALKKTLVVIERLKQKQ